MLAEDFPGIRSILGLPHRFEALKGSDQSSLAAADLVISAGVDYATDVAIDRRRGSNAGRPAHLSTWVEEFAIVGHAVAILGADALGSGFGDDGYPVFRLTDWPDQSGALIVEAGCGNVFQPHGAADLQMTVALASRLALDVLAGTVTTSIRRVWQGDRQQVLAKGGVLRDSFADSNVIKEFAWP